MAEDDLETQIQKYIDEHFPDDLKIPTGVTEDEAVHAIQHQLQDAGFDAPTETARRILIKARGLTWYGLAELDSDGNPVRYLPPLGEGFVLGSAYRLVDDRAEAWRMAEKEFAQERAVEFNSTPGNRPRLHVIELPAEG
jgi:hypothetical protein